MHPTDVPAIRQLQGKMSAVAVSHMYHCNPETIRKIWRGETYKQNVPTAPTMDLTAMPVPDFADDLLKDLMQQGSGPERKE
jgi:hypothetical protein